MITKSKKSFSTVSGESFFKERQLIDSNEDNCFVQHLNNLCRKNIGHLILAQLVYDQIEQSVYAVKKKADVIMIIDTKLDYFYPTMQPGIEGYYNFRLNQNRNGGGILVYVPVSF